MKGCLFFPFLLFPDTGDKRGDRCMGMSLREGGKKASEEDRQSLSRRMGKERERERLVVQDIRLVEERVRGCEDKITGRE